MASLSCTNRLAVSASVSQYALCRRVKKSTDHYSFVVDKGALLKALRGKKMEGKRRRDIGHCTQRAKNTEREHGLDAYLKAHNVEIGAVSTLETRVRGWDLRA